VVFSYWSNRAGFVLSSAKMAAEFVGEMGYHAALFLGNWHDATGLSRKLYSLGILGVLSFSSSVRIKLTFSLRVFFNGWVMTRYQAWWSKYNYILVLLPPLCPHPKLILRYRRLA
jgi:hypothetical protein